MKLNSTVNNDDFAKSVPHRNLLFVFDEIDFTLVKIHEDTLGEVDGFLHF